MKIKLGDSFKPELNGLIDDELYLKKIQMELEKRGFLKINGMYLSYSYVINLDDIKYYVNCENANGRNISKFKDLTNAIQTLKNVKLQDYTGLISRCKLSYKLIRYDDILFIYVFNNKYKDMFNDDIMNIDTSEKFNDLD